VELKALILSNHALSPSGVDGGAFSVSACAAVAAQRGVQLSLTNVEVRNMEADSGAVCVDGSRAARDSMGQGSDPSLSLISSTIKANIARLSGAAVALKDGNALAISATRFEGNRLQQSGRPESSSRSAGSGLESTV
jgi:hypothetical protein